MELKNHFSTELYKCRQTAKKYKMFCCSLREDILQISVSIYPLRPTWAWN